jgi:hypothetical protein
MRTLAPTRRVLVSLAVLALCPKDAEVIPHEYAHAMMDSQMTPFGLGGSAEAAAIGEG